MWYGPHTLVTESMKCLPSSTYWRYKDEKNGKTKQKFIEDYINGKNILFFPVKFILGSTLGYIPSRNSSGISFYMILNFIWQVSKTVENFEKYIVIDSVIHWQIIEMENSRT